ncbi:MAG: starch synthase [Candidatus Eremiobacteraeota bacterium]|nr:starch synthase [Candidatus Eremiobacteraeota bacterium]
MARVRVLSAASEVFPLVKTGGLADVAGALPKALAAEDVAVTTLVPGYPAVIEALRNPTPVLAFDVFGGSARVLAGTASGLDLFVLDAPHLFARAGNPYTGPDGRDWPDNAFRFAAFARVAARIACGAVSGYRPDVVHAHDWQAGLIPAYLHYANAPVPPSVMTVHNLAFQGLFARELLPALGLPPHAYSVEGVEYYGHVGYLKAGLQFADRITTVSPTYAAEITTAHGGMGLDGLLRKRAAVLSGILNGIDVGVWNPASDPYLAATYDAEHIGARAANTAALQARLGLDVDPHALCIGVISRLTEQKGLDLLIDALRHLLELGAQLAMLGAGDAALERTFAGAAKAHPGRIGVVIGYDESLAHQIQAGASALLVPSRFEPCGLTQLCALRYGAVPVVARVGGLADTVIDANEMALAAGVATGIQFAPPAREMLEHALSRTAALFADRAAWTRVQANGMRTDVSWRGPAHRYANLYREVIAPS